MEAARNPHPSSVEPGYSEINMSQIRVGGGVVGLIFATGTVYIFVMGIPAVRPFFFAAVAAGSLISLALRYIHKHKPARVLPKIWAS